MIQRRLTGIDAARGIALLGMIATHALPLYHPETGDPTLTGLVFSGRSSALFAVVAGVGLALLTGGSEPHDAKAVGRDRRGIAVRALIIAVVGLALGGLETNIALILFHYAVLFLLALPFLGMPLRRLACWAGGWLLLSPVLAYLLRGWLLQNLSPSEIEGNLTWDAWGTPAVLAADVFVTGFYPVLQWLSYILLGLVIGRLALTDLRVQVGLLAAGVFAAVAAKFMSSYLLRELGGLDVLAGTDSGQVWPLERMMEVNLSSVEQTGSWWWLALSGPHSNTSLDMLHTSGTAAAVLGICLLLTRARPNLLLPLSAAGAMTLTLYSMHVWVMTIVDLQNPPLEPLPVYWIQVTFYVVLAILFQKINARGPLELVTSGASRLARGKTGRGTAAARPKR
ncbi:MULTISPECIES: heparan-alpha-glucosaminide N-acetyltransferase domain-containing protein [unclassified Arthrobacter]|uniref:heparan-alpha-glucosaminide N-acetyltransferase domain-containing protein n=1 Tax=unclassified Arthrobacter TaxID=235627 RepID=UPI001E2C0B08|nr:MULTISPECIES: heparan-alpha-glucosaminide N-acetyltransferase domain-containing protein [unclassified Arthrobacter]MCC9146286.1 DUF1624 domain-containing protein [Arthrobacter sp. zg-Y919]MDK1277516.1 heparan-alpha-glucosaminide N-acetyltransferase domain-containing protein [Arthrobacter sp. zg.Y919]WIB04001.1 heparan-alpha-glucosaminide N-acetyltransferase domain-containing protein [Arthrobacter sp. zg-Y919]